MNRMFTRLFTQHCEVKGAYSQYCFIIIHSKWYFINLQNTAASGAEQKHCSNAATLIGYLHEQGMLINDVKHFPKQLLPVGDWVFRIIVILVRLTRDQSIHLTHLVLYRVKSGCVTASLLCASTRPCAASRRVHRPNHHIGVHVGSSD